MLKKALLGVAMLVTVGTGFASASPACSPWYMPQGNYYDRFVRDWVRLYLRRDPTQKEVLLISNQLRSGMSAEAVQANILASPEYVRRNNNNNILWGRNVVADVLGRPA